MTQYNTQNRDTIGIVGVLGGKSSAYGINNRYFRIGHHRDTGDPHVYVSNVAIFLSV